jgi:alpha/beta superfamily hydrolase
MHPVKHAQSSALKFGGQPSDYQAIHDFMDSSKAHHADFRHRAILHNSFGIFIAEQVFGHTITNSNGKEVPVRPIAEQHVQEDLGYIPCVADWLRTIKSEPWMRKAGKLENVYRIQETVTPASCTTPGPECSGSEFPAGAGNGAEDQRSTLVPEK